MGRDFDFDPLEFAAGRRGPLERATAWWREHRDEPRDEWLRSYFAERGHVIERFDETAIPVLIEALDGESGTRRLAIEQLARITGFVFDVRDDSSYRGAEYTWAMVVGKLVARGLYAVEE